MSNLDRGHFLVPDAGAVTELALGACLTIGRGAGADLIVRAPEVSRHHATLAWSEAGELVLCVHGRNGAYLDGVALEAGVRRPLRGGEELRFGDDYRCTYLHADSDTLRRFLLEREEGATRLHALGAGEEAEELSTVEREVARWVAEGEDDAAIAARLGLSEDEVRGHVHEACAKTDTAGRSELAALILSGHKPGRVV